MFFNKLYVRIWLAVVLAVVVLTMLVGWAWRMAAEPPLREVVVRNEAGEVIGNGQARLRRPPSSGWRLDRPFGGPPPSPPDDKQVPTGEPPGDGPDDDAPGRFGRGPEFLVRMQDGQTMHLHLPRPPQSSMRAPFGFLWTLGLVAVAVALGTYPIVRRLTRRLETLQNGVERWGDGDLSVRVPMTGDDEVGFLASRFNRAAQQIETLVKSHESLLASQKSLLANASHELRSPLTRIRMGLELMGATPSPSFKQEISRNVSELDQLIEEILLASRLDAKEADLGTIEPVDLVGLAAEECARTQATLDATTGELVVPGVAKLLRRAVRNLLENARRYGAGEVSLELEQDGTHAIVRVCDRGPGVPEALQGRIFEPFYRLPGASERDGGVGLGLALVRSITLRHHGVVTCSNRVDGGACFEIRLPLSNNA
ncbi:HAMP domain-containing sensor histidine kinase [Rhodoferax saidenbachensis]|uniref:histidine kinase n=1 Tax=Rhodoferax saidenbachensis TaxID=1484693 RepID=A0ABU1ZN22_9BURK|nr:HAMP domain-containing sensor histidine kinase [Rhodoferax saidenbachensis]MDR7306928.1 signal transduction histidine kinase [Rhodoferax saidenbachensis]